MRDQSTFQHSLMQVVDHVLDTHAIMLQANSDFYRRVHAGPSMVYYPTDDSGNYWRKPMSKAQVLTCAPTVVNTLAVHAVVMLAGALDYYLYRMCKLVYEKSDIVDRSWFSLSIIEPACGVNPATCLKWPEIQELFNTWQAFVRPEIYDTGGMIEANRHIIEHYAEAIRIFAIDFERALVVVHPEVKLP